jgi:2-polyprenyl-6-methoxyphenol hydroxylase-like FAD-dependent oxidoreductase
MDNEVRSVVVVGGGIAGGALAQALACEGVEVTVLERTTAYADRVRGEVIQAWGLADAQKLGVEDVLLDAGGRHSPLWQLYTQWATEPTQIPMNVLVPGVEGTLSIGHPTACQALIDAAETAGAVVIRGVESVEVTAGASPEISWRLGDESFTATPDLIIGADGRRSTVRKQVGIDRELEPGLSCITGLLVEGLDGVPYDFEATVADDDLQMLIFHQTASRARIYLCTGLGDKSRFTGKHGPERFLEACGGRPFPWSDQIAAGTAAGPCGTVVGDDEWATKPFVDGVVLIGDAAGYGDPILGQGLAMSLRDARVVRDLILSGDATPAGFAAYGDGRVARAKRYALAADIVAVTNAEACDNKEARQEKFNELMASPDGALATVVLGAFAGPETVPDEFLDMTLPDQIRAGV